MDTKTCSKCGRHTDGEEPHGLCPSCLLAQNAFTEMLDRSDRLCASCDHTLADDARFCASCGTPAPATPSSSDDPLRQALEAKLGGQYRVLRLLGRGGMGAVYLARDLTLEREVAIKVVKPASDAQGMYDRFRREAKTAAKLSHPNIVPLHAFGEIDGMPFFVMGYVRGESLAERLRREGKLPETESRRILAEVADALDHAHRQGVVHRDVKPDNVLLEDASGRALLTDFGIAKTMNRGETLTQHGSVVGTPHYMSPEQAAGRTDIDGRTDIYSLGVMGYAMLAGRLPFEGNSAANVLAKHLTQSPTPLRSLAPTISDSTLQAVERCMAKDPAKRWADSRALKLALGATEENRLPEALEAVQGQGVAFIAKAAVMLLLSWLVIIRMQHAPIGVLGIITATIVVGYVMLVASLRFQGFPVALAQRVIWTEPSWWPFWYPRGLRRRSNVWDRLPRSVQRLRWFTVTLLPWTASMVLVFVFLEFPSGNGAKTLAMALFGIVITGATEFAAKRELKRMGITSRQDRHRIASGSPPSHPTFWSQPHIAVVLGPPLQGETLRHADSPHDQLRSILRLADELSGPLRPLGAEAATAARRLVGSIEQSNKQIADLARNLEPGEEQRLVEKVGALANIEESSPMRVLIEKQLELIRDLTVRIEDAKERRNRHIEMLKTLALHLASLHARLGETPSEVRSLSDNVRALCDHISQQGVAMADDLPTVELRNTPM
ncbi:MAG TPA: protein kinase [Thermoanaerobaculia bacterium]|nr:protein kinase [Thermoanaerobaculia bacterium]